MSKNRFKKGRKIDLWGFQDECFICGKNEWNVLHHIISESSRNYKKGKFNGSILNSCPIHNEKCHLYNPKLHKSLTEKWLLKKTLYHFAKNNLKPNDKDREFFKIYSHLYQ